MKADLPVFWGTYPRSLPTNIMDDISFEEEKLALLAGIARAINILDHHDTSQWINIDMTKCGAELAWEYFITSP